MTTYVPVGLTHLLEDGSGNVTLSASDIVSDSGKAGPLLLKLTNSSDSNVAVVSYDNELIPQPIVTYTNITLGSNYGNAVVDITVDPADYIPVVTNIVSSQGNFVGQNMACGGALIGGQVALVYFVITSTTNPEALSPVTGLEYVSGYVPANAGGAILPTPGSPTKVFTIPPLASDLVQIPASNNGSTVLVASGANVYVTPIQIVA